MKRLLGKSIVPILLLLLSFAFILLSFVHPLLGAFGKRFIDLSNSIAIVFSMVTWVALISGWVLFIFVKQLSGELARITAVVLSLAAFSFLGVVVGLFVGLSGTDAVVLSAVLPAVLTLVGGYFVFKSESMEGKNRDSNIHSGLLSLSVVLFLIFLVLGTLLGKNERDKEEFKNAEAKRDLHLDWLRECIRIELRINNQRKLLDLPPLKTETICGF